MSVTERERRPALRALVLAGGVGTRLRGVLGSLPKPMAPVAGRPFLEYLLLQLRRDNIADVVLLTGHGAERIERYFGTGGGRYPTIAYSAEPAPLGTGGALRLAAARFPAQRFLVMNGDSFFDIPLRDLLDEHVRFGEMAAPGRVTRSRATLALVASSDTGRFGRAEIDARGSITRFAEKEPAAGPGLINAGIAVIEAGILDAIPHGASASLEQDVLPRLVGRGLRGVTFAAPFVDIGVPADYAALRSAPEPLVSLLR